MCCWNLHADQAGVTACSMMPGTVQPVALNVAGHHVLRASRFQHSRLGPLRQIRLPSWPCLVSRRTIRLRRKVSRLRCTPQWQTLQRLLGQRQHCMKGSLAAQQRVFRLPASPLGPCAARSSTAMILSVMLKAARPHLCMRCPRGPPPRLWRCTLLKKSCRLTSLRGFMCASTAPEGRPARLPCHLGS